MRSKETTFDYTKVRCKGYLKNLKTGSKGFFAGDIRSLKEQVELYCLVGTLTRIDNSFEPFQKDGAFWYAYFYIVEEPKEEE